MSIAPTFGGGFFLKSRTERFRAIRQAQMAVLLALVPGGKTMSSSEIHAILRDNLEVPNQIEDAWTNMLLSGLIDDLGRGQYRINAKGRRELEERD